MTGNRAYTTVAITSLTKEKADELAGILGLPSGTYLAESPISIQFTGSGAVVTWQSITVADRDKVGQFVRGLE